MTPDEKIGYDAYWRGPDRSQNPYPWNSATWWLADQWEKGWEAAQWDASEDD
jgi:hypothetical protein